MNGRCASARLAPERSVVAWVGVIGAVSAQEVMARFGVGRTVGYRRLAALVEHGLLSRARLVYGRSALYVTTRGGWRAPRSAMTAPRWPVGETSRVRSRLDC
jgi:hypothetical protein